MVSIELVQAAQHQQNRNYIMNVFRFLICTQVTAVDDHTGRTVGHRASVINGVMRYSKRHKVCVRLPVVGTYRYACSKAVTAVPVMGAVLNSSEESA